MRIVTPTPVHVVTGFLGSGKSTLIHELLRLKPAGERWAVVVNEFGQVGIDQAMFEAGDEIIVKGVPGGCLCCQLSFVLQASLVNLLHRQRPDRLLIEPSGLGHPAGLLDLLRGEAFDGVLEVKEVIAVLDPRRLDEPRVQANATFHDQLALADGVALTQVDQASEAQRLEARRHLEGLWPPKRWICEAPFGRLPASLLFDSPQRDAGHDERPAAHQALRPPAEPREAPQEETPPEPGRAIFRRGESLGHVSLGWRWHPAEVFDLDRLSHRLGELAGDLRIKAVIHAETGWWLYNRAEGRVGLTESAWRRDSRLELIGESGRLPEVKEIEGLLEACRLTAVPGA
ncbi:CobW family GTP-binding protein [Halomonas sp. NCCP-2165]|nr:GTP-binding protein [Halomonas sp. NCCP-2165]GKW48088.1 cobalamin biosynthesis protein CobW [Halomonas sp. NCCP-2165]